MRASARSRESRQACAATATVSPSFLAVHAAMLDRQMKYASAQSDRLNYYYYYY